MKFKYFIFWFAFFGTFSIMSLIYNKYIWWGLSYSAFMSMAFTVKTIPYWLED